MLIEMLSTHADANQILLAGKVYDLKDEKFVAELIKQNACKPSDIDALPPKGTTARKLAMPDSTPDPLGKK